MPGPAGATTTPGLFVRQGAKMLRPPLQSRVTRYNRTVTVGL